MVEKVLPTRLTREEISKFAANPRQVRFFEELTTQVAEGLPNSIEIVQAQVDDLAIQAAILQIAIDQVSSLSEALRRELEAVESMIPNNQYAHLVRRVKDLETYVSMVK